MLFKKALKPGMKNIPRVPERDGVLSKELSRLPHRGIEVDTDLIESGRVPDFLGNEVLSQSQLLPLQRGSCGQAYTITFVVSLSRFLELV